MKLKVFSVRDAKAEAFLQPYFCPTKGQAIRGFTDAVNDSQHPMNKHPEDYALFEIGEFDDSNGSLTMHQQPIPLGLALEVLQVKQ